MKKLNLILIVLVSFLCAGNLLKKAEASDYYLGAYENGQEAYLMTESIENYSLYQKGYYEGEVYNCTVKAVYPLSEDYDTIKYKVTCSQFLGMQKDGEWLYNLKTQREFFDSHPVEKALANYIMEIDSQKRNRRR